MIVSRNTSHMDKSAICRTTIESVAENLVDGVISPLFFITLGLGFGWAAPLVWFFKAISTLDSMVGYKTVNYLHFGKASAKLDDAANFIPARLSIGLITLGACVCGPQVSVWQAWRLGWADRLKHQSPNSGHPEAAFAGALGIGFGGPTLYENTWENKAAIGKPEVPVTPDMLNRAIRLQLLTSILSLGIVLLPYTLFAILGHTP
jgi:adenosylcobinamide-phosphate synthase